MHSHLLSKVPNIQHAFQTKDDSRPTDLTSCKQVHGKVVLHVKDNPSAELRNIPADGLLTKNSYCVGIQTADCIPALFAEVSGRVIAAVHAGWRGLAEGILVETVELFKREGVTPQNLVIAIGPAIGPCCFEVGNEVIESFQEKWGHLWSRGSEPWQKYPSKNVHSKLSKAPETSNGLWLHLDQLARLQLVSCGLLDHHIEDVGTCTYCGPESFASYRRATNEKKSAARQWSWIKKMKS